MSLMKRTNNWLPAVFDDMFDTDWMGGVSTDSIGINTPAVNVKETDNGFFVEVAAPGMKKEDFEIEVDKDLLTISSETGKSTENEAADEKFTRREFSYRSFKRSFTLPDSVDSTKISANYEAGVLNIEIPKREEAKAQPKRLIEIA